MKKTDFEKGQILALKFGTQGTKAVKKYAGLAQNVSPECFEGFKDGMKIAIRVLEKMQSEAI